MTPIPSLRQLLLLLPLVLSSLTAHAQSDCDCSCESYEAVQQMAEQMRAQAESGQPQQLPPEAMQMAMCGQPCAQAWAQCAMGREPEPQAASGQDAIDQERRIHEAQSGGTGPSAADDAAQLTEAYLEGMWCSIYGGQEKAQWRFHADGRYEIGMPAGNGWSMQPGGADLDAFRNRFERVIAIDGDRFVTEHRHGRNNVFTRGPC